MYPDYVSKHNSSHEKQVIILIIPNEEERKVKSKGCKAKSGEGKAKSEGRRRWHYLPAKKLSAFY